MSYNLLIVGLGNPGNKYNKTRHNLGATWVKRLCELHHFKLKPHINLHANIATVDKLQLICMIPEDYMNNSGISVKLGSKFYDIAPNNVLVVHDELDLLVGEIKFKLCGGHGGHNGLRDVIEKLNSNEFKRLRIGIGAPKIREQIVEYVLNSPSYIEQTLIDQAITKSLQLFPEIASLNWQKAMQLLHTKNLGEQSL